MDKFEIKVIINLQMPSRPKTKPELKANSPKDSSGNVIVKKVTKKATKSIKDPKIIFENKNMLVLDKPAGLVVHPDGKTKESTLCDWLVSHYPKIKKVGEPLIINKGTPNEIQIDRPGIVHRLDRETSGVIIVAKNQESFLHLKSQFQDRETKKTYKAFVWGILKDQKGVIDRPIGRSKTDFRKYSAGRFARGELRDAITRYRVLGNIDRYEPIDSELDAETDNQRKIPHNFTLLDIMPETGRTHQIRVHMKAINHPVVGDSLYAENHPYVLGFKRTALHASRLKISDMDGKVYEFEAPLPKDFKDASLLIK